MKLLRLELNLETKNSRLRKDKTILKTGFQLQAEGNISLKKYSEGVSEANSLFQLRGYSIKYESIRRTKLYQTLKE